MGAPCPPYVVPDGVFCVGTLVVATPFGTSAFVIGTVCPMPSACLRRQL